ncbi:MAG: helix-turn-helix domain-containing protein, partial [Bombilactobacillus sp.]|nr:helix-turn-helix domain-containing protein [Bombilactobacillus sp.]
MKDRQLLLINKLLSQGKLAIGELSHILTVSSRTIRNDVTEINQTLGDLALAQITNNRGQLTFHLSLKEKQTLARYLAIGADSFLDPKKRQLDIIISFLQAPKQVKIYEEQEKLQVSKSTMAKDIRQVRRFLAKYSLI